MDAQLVAAGVERLAPRAAAGTARRLAYAADPEGSLRRARTARKDRRVSLRPLPDTMAGLSAFLPVEQGVACWAALKARVDELKAAGDPRTRGQIAADTLVERLTGQATADDVDVEVQSWCRWRICSTPSTRSRSRWPGSGRSRPGWPIRSSATPQRSALVAATVHRPDPRPTNGRVIVGGDPSARRFTGWLAKLIKLRDQHCREPFCTAPIRHIDHIARVCDGGPTTFENGRGVCEHHNYLREMPGWQIKTVSEPGQRHATITTTPTGHHYLSRAPNPP